MPRCPDCGCETMREAANYRSGEPEWRCGCLCLYDSATGRVRECAARVPGRYVGPETLAHPCRGRLPLAMPHKQNMEDIWKR